MNRRAFLKSAPAVPVVAAGMHSSAGARPAAARASRAGDLPVRISCNLYSFNRLLRSGEMSLEEVIAFCAELGFDAVDPTGYYFPNYPDVPEDAYLYHIKRKAFLLGLDISGTGVRNDFTVPDLAKRQADVEHVKQWIGCAARLGAPVIRVFTGRGVPEGHTRAEVTEWVVEGLRACADYGSQHGVLVALQNHADFAETAEEVLTLLRRVGSDWLGVVLDVGSFRTEDPYADIAAVAPHAFSWQVKEYLTVGGEEVRTDLNKIVDIVRTSGYRGYLPIETLGEGDPRMKVPVFLDEVRAALA